MAKNSIILIEEHIFIIPLHNKKVRYFEIENEQEVREIKNIKTSALSTPRMIARIALEVGNLDFFDTIFTVTKLQV